MKINNSGTKNLEPIKTVAIPHVGCYSGIAGAFENLVAWATTNNLWATSPKMLGVYCDDPSHTPVDKLRSKACLEDLTEVALSAGMEYYTISGGKYFVMQVEVSMAEYTKAWQEAYEAFNQKGYQYDARDHYELYVSCAGDSQDPNSPWVVDLCIPMK